MTDDVDTDTSTDSGRGEKAIADLLDTINDARRIRRKAREAYADSLPPFVEKLFEDLDQNSDKTEELAREARDALDKVSKKLDAEADDVDEDENVSDDGDSEDDDT